LSFGPTTGPIFRRNRKLRKPKPSVSGLIQCLFLQSTIRSAFGLGNYRKIELQMDSRPLFVSAFTTSNGISLHLLALTGQCFWTPDSTTYGKRVYRERPSGRTITTPTQTRHPPHGQRKPIYQLPIGRGKHFGGNMNRGPWHAIIGGWQLAGIFRWNHRPAEWPALMTQDSGRPTGKCRARDHGRSCQDLSSRGDANNAHEALWCDTVAA